MVEPLSVVLEGPVIPLVGRGDFVTVWIWLIETHEQLWIGVVSVDVFVVVAQFVLIWVDDTNLVSVSSWDVFDPSALLLKSFGGLVSESCAKHFFFF